MMFNTAIVFGLPASLVLVSRIAASGENQLLELMEGKTPIWIMADSYRFKNAVDWNAGNGVYDFAFITADEEEKTDTFRWLRVAPIEKELKYVLHAVGDAK